jgi:hypothetical protein
VSQEEEALRKRVMKERKNDEFEVKEATRILVQEQIPFVARRLPHLTLNLSGLVNSLFFLFRAASFLCPFGVPFLGSSSSLLSRPFFVSSLSLSRPFFVPSSSLPRPYLSLSLPPPVPTFVLLRPFFVPSSSVHAFLVSLNPFLIPSFLKNSKNFGDFI